VKNLYQFYWDCGRSGYVEGVFLAEPRVITDAMGCELYLGEVLGKHSDVHGVLEEGDIVRLPDATPEFIEQFAVIFPNGIGYNPLGYLEDNK